MKDHKVDSEEWDDPPLDESDDDSDLRAFDIGGMVVGATLVFLVVATVAYDSLTAAVPYAALLTAFTVGWGAVR